MNFFIALFLFSASLFAAAANAQCPEISITGPAGIIKPGENMKFTVEVGPTENHSALKYVWSVSSGAIVSGQGTSTIEAKPTGTSLTASIKIGGLPEDCASTASLAAAWDPAPTPIKVGAWKDDSDLTPLQRFAVVMAIEAAHQGYVFIVRGPTSTPESLNSLKETVISFSPKEGAVYSPRITIVEAEGPEQLVELWRVPPGASNPECESCSNKECPELTTVGPAVVPVPGKFLTFSLSLKGQPLSGLRYVWSVNTGQIISGQGTRSIQVIPPWETDWNLQATVEVFGLQPGCPALAVESIMRPDLPHPVMIDEFDVTPALQDQNRLKVAIEDLLNNPSDQLFVILYHPKSEPTLKVREVVKKLTGFFKRSSYLESERYSVVSSPSDRYFMRIYRIPPGADKPTP